MLLFRHERKDKNQSDKALPRDFFAAERGKLMQETRSQVHDPQREPVRAPPEVPAVPHPQPDIEPGRAPEPELPSLPPEPDIPAGPQGPEIIPDPSPPEYPDTGTPGEPGEE
jgi:hypothetical protein